MPAAAVTRSEGVTISASPLRVALAATAVAPTDVSVRADHYLAAEERFRIAMARQ
jgi:hypothetical protein